MSIASRNTDPTSLYQHIDSGQPSPSMEDIANYNNNAFLSVVSEFEPLEPNFPGRPEETPPHFHVTEESVLKKLSALNPSKDTGPDGVPAWLLQENADLFSRPIADIMNKSFQESKLPQSWKDADIVPIPKQKPIHNVNKHLRRISLTPVLSKIAEDYIVEYIKPAVLAKVDEYQFGTVPKSSTTLALISMVHSWLSGTDGNGGTVHAVLFDFRKAFNLIDHRILVNKLSTYGLPNSLVSIIGS
ncbi:uncharacterized protein LOC110232605 [Exaiptasia diaphana]|uniref:Reverse transcriptase domain-containing protein n=1 Tax=Exaiptasia diaphana TaxID=2652724 RepID=A0A913WSL9_EXADI|nr:uncharacterized protein LOC110232605 [Exaiptasia diaphana]